jgi:hypothetical protein
MSAPKALFSPGQIVATPGALSMGIDLLTYLKCHLTGEWGDLSANDKRENELALGQPLRILSAYNTTAGRLWIITEADRSATTLLTPDEY